MGNSCFRFKRFSVFQDRCAMKVGTDGVVLGAWCSVADSFFPNKEATATDSVIMPHILDVGTGSGVIALMLAQRNPDAKIWALDCDLSAVQQATENVAISPFANRIELLHTTFQKFAATTSLRFDLIVSNPPYFTHSLLPPGRQRAIARHDISLPLDQLLDCVARCLSPCGVFSLILPYSQRDLLSVSARSAKLNIRRKTVLYSRPSYHPKRILVELHKIITEADQELFVGNRKLGETETAAVVSDTLVIENDPGEYTHSFRELLKDFYLAF